MTAVAVLVYVKKVDETETSVRYEFGASPQELTRVLTFDKDTQRAQPEDERANASFMGAYSAVIKKFNADGTWPDSGVHAS